MAAGEEVVLPVVAGVAEEAALVAEVVEASAEVVPDVVSEQKITISNQYRGRYKDKIYTCFFLIGRGRRFVFHT